MPATQLERRGHAHTHHAAAQRAQPVEQAVQVLADGGQQGFAVGKGVVQHQALAHMAGEVHQQPVGAAPPDLDAHGKGTVGVQADRHRRLAHPSAHRRFAREQLVFVEPGGDQADGLGREAGEPRQLGLGATAVHAQGLQHHAVVELAHAHLVGAARAQPGVVGGLRAGFGGRPVGGFGRFGVVHSRRV